MSESIFAAVVVAVAVVVICAFMLGLRGFAHHYEEATCRSFGAHSGRDVEFVDYTFWSWDCLTPSSDGKKISAKLLREVPRGERAD